MDFSFFLPVLFVVCNIEAISFRAGALHRHRTTVGQFAPSRSFHGGTGILWLAYVQSISRRFPLLHRILRSTNSSRWHGLVLASLSSVVSAAIFHCDWSSSSSVAHIRGQKRLMGECENLDCWTAISLRSLQLYQGNLLYGVTSLELLLQSTSKSPTSVVDYIALLLQHGLQTGVRRSIAGHNAARAHVI